MVSREKRRAPRARHDSVLEIFDASRRQIISIGRLINVSTVGACFASQHPLKKGTLIQARLRLLREGRLDVSARVVWVRRRANVTLYGVGFESVRPVSPRGSDEAD